EAHLNGRGTDRSGYEHHARRDRQRGREAVGNRGTRILELSGVLEHIAGPRGRGGLFLLRVIAPRDDPLNAKRIGYGLRGVGRGTYTEHPNTDDNRSNSGLHDDSRWWRPAAAVKAAASNR